MVCREKGGGGGRQQQQQQGQWVMSGGEEGGAFPLPMHHRTALGCMACTVLPCLSVGLALLALFFLAPLALRMGLLKSSDSGEGGWGGGAAAHPTGSTCSAVGGALEAAVGKGSVEPCVFVLMDAATCSGGKRLVVKLVGWALRVRDAVLPLAWR